MKSSADFEACLLGGAIGDALAAPIEFSHYPRILEELGPEGVRDFVTWQHYGLDARGCFTDDTQMTLFSADGLVRAWLHAEDKGNAQGYRRQTHRAYLRWYATQECSACVPFLSLIDGVRRSLIQPNMEIIGMGPFKGELISAKAACMFMRCSANAKAKFWKNVEKWC